MNTYTKLMCRCGIILLMLLVLGMSVLRGGDSPEYNVTIGSVFEISADNVSGVTSFTRKPKVYITGGDLGSKKKSVRVMNKGSEFKEGVTTLKCEWKGKVEPGTYELHVYTKKRKNHKNGTKRHPFT